MTPRLWAALENEMSLWPTRTEERRSIPGAEPMRGISVLSSFNWSLFWTTKTFTSEMQASMVYERVKALEGESDLYKSVSSANIWWETQWWLITSERGWVYRMKRIGPKTEPWGTPQVRSEGEDFIPFTITTGSNRQNKQDLAVQHHQLHRQVKALQVSLNLHPPERLWNMDPACWL